MSLCLALLFACAPDPATEGPADLPTAPAPEVPVPDPRAPRKHAPPSDPALAAALQRIQADEPPCMGGFARVDVWRTPEGDVHRLFFRGDMQCSHPPSVWYEPDGTRLEVVPMEPLTDENRAKYDGIWSRHTTGAEKAETLFFPG